jgi:hypothetical protein
LTKATGKTTVLGGAKGTKTGTKKGGKATGTGGGSNNSGATCKLPIDLRIEDQALILVSASSSSGLAPIATAAPALIGAAALAILAL